MWGDFHRLSQFRLHLTYWIVGNLWQLIVVQKCPTKESPSIFVEHILEVWKFINYCILMLEITLSSPERKKWKSWKSLRMIIKRAKSKTRSLPMASIFPAATDLVSSLSNRYCKDASLQPPACSAPCRAETIRTLLKYEWKCALASKSYLLQGT